MTEMLASWKQLIEDRKQTHAWDMEKEVNRQDIDDMLAELHRRVPSKQNRVTYKLSVIDYSDPEFRDSYYQFCVDNDNPNWCYNPQVLAPYLLVFSFRSPADFPYDFSDSGYDDNAKQLSCIEVGLASDFIVHAAAARGMNAGFCRCYDTAHEKVHSISEKLGLESVDEIILSIGVGYSSNRAKTLNPYTGEMVDAPYDIKWLSEPKPDRSEYIKFIK